MNTIFVGNIRVDEPVVTLTDLLVSFLCFLFFYKLTKLGGKNRAILFFTYYFLLMGIATFLGGILGHAFLYKLSMPWKLPGWITSMLSIMLIERAAINHTRLLFPVKVINILQIINILELIVFMSLSIWLLDFFYVEFHSAYGLMFVVLSLEGILYYKTRNRASAWILTGIGFAALAALFFMNEWSIHQWFNHISMSHILMAVASVFLYRGAAQIELKGTKH